MTKKDYIKLARAIKKAHDLVSPSAQDGVACVFNIIADVLAEDNNLFDRHKFYDAVYK